MQEGARYLRLLMEENQKNSKSGCLQEVAASAGRRLALNTSFLHFDPYKYITN